MGLDVYVMPIWRFKAGDFTSPVEALGLGIPHFKIEPSGVTQHHRGAKPGFIARYKARRATELLRRKIETEIGHPIRWDDSGDVAYAEQSQGFESLRVFAKWLDYRDLLPTFDAPPEGNFYKHPVMSGKLARPLAYPQLVDHSCYSGYYLPVDLDRVVYVEPYSCWDAYVFYRSVGSSTRLLQELQQLSGMLAAGGQYQWQNGDPRAEVKTAFDQLFEIATISCQRQLPIIFHG